MANTMNHLMILPLMPTDPIEAEKTAEVSAHTKPVPQIKPWIRYLARTIDVYLFSLLLGIALGMFVQETQR